LFNVCSSDGCSLFVSRGGAIEFSAMNPEQLPKSAAPALSRDGSHNAGHP